MPFYDYACDDCGTFTRLRPMAEAAEASPCPECGEAARRVILTAPRLSMMDAGRRSASATNERSAHEPKRASGGHGAGCGCCGLKPKGFSPPAGNAAKGFPSKRPWMISH
ncbi:MAG: zinc ribbon domain-containing protein [Aurantimonas endophytica]|uniref:FmdB family zinc ribbon protein n=1 Tax=Aurantimonas endophytica TaxID=1522175 RepID=UPI0030039CC5